MLPNRHFRDNKKRWVLGEACCFECLSPSWLLAKAAPFTEETKACIGSIMVKVKTGKDGKRKETRAEKHARLESQKQAREGE